MPKLKTIDEGRYVEKLVRLALRDLRMQHYRSLQEHLVLLYFKGGCAIRSLWNQTAERPSGIQLLAPCAEPTMNLDALSECLEKCDTPAVLQCLVWKYWMAMPKQACGDCNVPASVRCCLMLILERLLQLLPAARKPVQSCSSAATQQETQTSATTRQEVVQMLDALKTRLGMDGITAKELGVDFRVLSRWRTGLANPSAYNLYKLKNLYSK